MEQVLGDGEVGDAAPAPRPGLPHHSPLANAADCEINCRNIKRFKKLVTHMEQVLGGGEVEDAPAAPRPVLPHHPRVLPPLAHPRAITGVEARARACGGEEGGRILLEDLRRLWL